MRLTHLLILATAGCATVPTKKTNTMMKPPIADKKPHVTELHGDKLMDDYYWMRHREDKEVIAYLEAENAYTTAMTAQSEAMRKTLFDEMLGRIKEDDSSVPAKKGEYWYYHRTESKKPYRIYCRKKGSLDAPEEVLIDGNALADGHEYFRLGTWEVSPDQQTLAYSVDYNGSERYTLHFKDLKGGKVLEESVADTYYSIAWGNDNKTIFYNTVDEASRPYKLFRHVVGTDASKDELVFHEKDDAYFLGIDKSLSEKFLFIELSSAVTTEIHYLSADDPSGSFKVVHPRQQGMEYDVEHHGDRFLIRTNEDAINFKLMQAPAADPKKANWTPMREHRDDVTLSGVDAFKDHIILYERERGLPQIRVTRVSSGEEHVMAFDEPTFDVWPDWNIEFDTTVLRYGYTSLVTPASVFDYDMNEKTRELLKTQPVIGYDPSQYTSERIVAKAKDGVEVPISIVYKKGLAKDGSAPMLLNGYGSYGYPYDASFESMWLSLLERGFVVGIAHIRGGGELGRKWKEDGKFERKMNTFTDFIACADHLVASKYTSASKLAVSGRSAGGLLMGVIANLRPDLFSVVIAGVPFVDVVNTMIDETIPLTVTEWEEWGNPNDKHFYDVIKKYSPYDNVVAQAYPNMLITAGLNDPRVQYWEPAKWTAKLRVTKTDDNLLLLKTEMGAGHGGQSGRYGRLEDRAFEYAFIFDRFGITQ